jgi:hypothetical protein
VLISTALGYLAASFFWPRVLPRITLWVFAVPLGAGLSSLIFFAFRRPMFTVEFALLILLGVAWYVRRPRSVSPGIGVIHLPPASLLLAALVGFVTAGLLFIVNQNPHGDWDAFAIWNSHARYLYRDGPAWKEHIQNTFHPDYPLLVPALNARAWRYTGREIPETGGWLGSIFTLSGVAILLATLHELRNVRVAMLMALVLLGTPFYLEYGAAQSADVPLSVFMVGTIALLCIYSQRAPSERGLLVLAGFLAGCAGWTKNEGLLFLGAISIAVGVPIVAVALGGAGLTRWAQVQGRLSLTGQRFAAFFSGLLLPLAVIVFFKLTIAGPSELTWNRHYPEVVEKIMSVERYGAILSSFGRTLWTFGEWAINPVIPLALFLGFSAIDRGTLRNWGFATGAATLAIVFAGYFATYLIAPYELHWILSGSNSRLFLHLWPSSLLLAGLLAVQYPHAR